MNSIDTNTTEVLMSSWNYNHLKKNIMIADNYKSYDSDERNLMPENPDQNQQPIGDENSFEEQFLSDENYVDSKFSNALDQNELEEDLEDDDEAEYDENDWEEEEEEEEEEEDDSSSTDDAEEIEPETFTDDSLKID